MDYHKPSTINDVAKLAGVSIATVSRFLNNTATIDRDTAMKVKNAIDELEFTPSRIARGLKTNKSQQIMLVVPDICNPFYSATYKVIQDAAHDKGYSVTLFNTNDNEKEEIEAIKTFKSINGDGIIFCSTFDRDRSINELKNLNVPVVLSNAFENPMFDTVHSSRGEGVYLATRYLIEQGHTNIGYVGGAVGSVLNERRKSGYLRAIDEGGIRYRDNYSFEMGFTMDAGYKAGMYFSTLSSSVTAIACANDLIAMGVMQALNECGIKIPEDISITGMDNIEYAALCKPALTTVTNNSTEFGMMATKLLFERIDGIYKGPPREIINARSLIIRDSVRKI